MYSAFFTLFVGLIFSLKGPFKSCDSLPATISSMTAALPVKAEGMTVCEKGDEFGETECIGNCQRLQGNSCPERNGRFPHPTQCDAYTECEDGVASDKLCPDGLLFDSKARFFSYPCRYPVEVDCEGRSGLQQARSTAECPHSYGYYKVGDENNCGKFKNCVEGRAFEFDCPEGLAFNEEALLCDWPDQVKSCNAEAYLGFTCPAESGLFGQEEFRSYRSPFDCRKFFICIKGRPRLYSCSEGYGFNEETGSCEKEEEVPACVFASGQEPSAVPPFRASRS